MGQELQAPVPSTKAVLHGLPDHLWQGLDPPVTFSVARVRPRTSKGITDLLLLNLVRLSAACPSKKLGCRYHSRAAKLFNRLESRSLSELTRQIAPPTKNGHAPPPTESRKSSQSVNPHGVRAG